MPKLHRDERDTTDPVDAKLKRGVDWVQQEYDDRFPARGHANIRTSEYRPLDNVSREGRQVPYRKYPAA